MSSRVMRLVVLTVSASALMAGSAGAVGQTAALGSIRARFSFRATHGSAAQPSYRNLRLRITRSGTVIYDAAVTSELCGRYCEPQALGRGSSVHVVRLNDDGTSQVVLDLLTGGAHCCSVSQVFSIDRATNAISESQEDWGDPGYRLADLAHDGRHEFITADDRFAYKFDAYAFSGLPIEIVRWRSGRFLDVTDDYPGLIAHDAHKWLADYRRNIASHSALGFLAAWAADEYHLGKREQVRGSWRRQTAVSN